MQSTAVSFPSPLPHLGDELHVAILDAVVHHLDVVAGADVAEVGGAWPVVDLRVSENA